MFSPKAISLILLTSLLTAAVPVLADVGGGAGPGGGDRCEARFKVVAADIKEWILEGGAKERLNLKVLGTPLTIDEYSRKMIEQIDKVRVKCVLDEVYVDGSPKECINFLDGAGMSRVSCNLKRFYSGLKEPENDGVQYRIVHHELATLAGFEKPNGDDSRYPLSDQIVGFRHNELFMRLSHNTPTIPTFLTELFQKQIILESCTGEENGKKMNMATPKGWEGKWGFYNESAGPNFYKLATQYGSISVDLLKLNENDNEVSDYSHETDMEGRPLKYGSDHEVVSGAWTHEAVTNEAVVRRTSNKLGYHNNQLRDIFTYSQEVMRLDSAHVKITFKNTFQTLGKTGTSETESCTGRLVNRIGRIGPPLN